MRAGGFEKLNWIASVSGRQEILAAPSISRHNTLRELAKAGRKRLGNRVAMKRTLAICAICCMVAACGQPDHHGAHAKRESRGVAAEPTGPSPPEACCPTPDQPAPGPQVESEPEYLYQSGPDYNISFEDLCRHVKDGTALVIDARTPAEFAQSHVRGAINIPADEVKAYTERDLRSVGPDQFIIIYCTSATCHASDLVYAHLQTQGFFNMRIFGPGWAWLANIQAIQ